MKTQIKIINDVSITKVNRLVNEFINDNEIEVIDVKITVTIHMFVCCVIYKHIGND